VPPTDTGAEQRIGLRRTGNLISVLLAINPEWEEPLRGWVLNRSTGGLGLLVEDPLEVGSECYVRPSSDDFSSYWFPIRIISCARDHLRWRIGCQFLKDYSWSDLRGFG
jgi:hypothetical protein